MDELEFKKVKDELDSVVKTIDKKLEEYSSDYKKASQGAKEDIKKELEPLLKAHSELQDTMKKMQGQLDEVDVKIQRVGPSKIKKPTFEDMAKLNLGNIAKGNKGSLRGLLDSKNKSIGFTMDFKTDDMTQGNSFESTTVVPYDYQPGIVYDPLNPYRVRDLITPGVTNSNVVSYIQEYAYSEAADITSEGSEYKQEDFDLKMLSENVYKITSYIIVSEEMLEDVAGLLSYINARLPEKLKVKEDDQLLYGTGSSEITGLTVDAADYTDNLSDTNITRIDVLVDAMRQVRTSEYRASGILIHPTDETLIKLAKDSTGQYIHPEWIFNNGPIRLNGVPVVVSTAITAGDFLVGDFKLGAQLFDRRQLALEMSFENEDNFVKGMVTVRLSERLALAIYRTKAFCYGTFAYALAAGSGS